MKWIELYEKNKFRKFREIDGIKNDIVLKARYQDYVKSHYKILITIICIILILLVLTFYSNPKLLFLTLFMFALILLLSVYFNTFTIICKNNKMIVKTNMQKVEIEYPKLKHVYIANRKSRIFIKKRDYFSLIILYQTPNKNIGNIELQTLFLNIKDTEKFLKTFILKEEKSNNNIVKAQKYNLKRLLIKICLFILIWAIIIITILLKY